MLLNEVQGVGIVHAGHDHGVGDDDAGRTLVAGFAKDNDFLLDWGALGVFCSCAIVRIDVHAGEVVIDAPDSLREHGDELLNIGDVDRVRLDTEVCGSFVGGDEADLGTSGVADGEEEGETLTAQSLPISKTGPWAQRDERKDLLSLAAHLVVPLGLLEAAGEAL